MHSQSGPFDLYFYYSSFSGNIRPGVLGYVARGSRRPMPCVPTRNCRMKVGFRTAEQPSETATSIDVSMSALP